MIHCKSSFSAGRKACESNLLAIYFSNFFVVILHFCSKKLQFSFSSLFPQTLPASNLFGKTCFRIDMTKTVLPGRNAISLLEGMGETACILITHALGGVVHRMILHQQPASLIQPQIHQIPVGRHPHIAGKQANTLAACLKNLVTCIMAAAKSLTIVWIW